jgi:hypothetical protein
MRPFASFEVGIVHQNGVVIFDYQSRWKAHWA